MNTSPDPKPTDDVEGHLARSGRFDAEAVTEDDVEGHRAYSSSDTNIKSDQSQVSFDEDDDTEGHRAYSGSDTNIKGDQTPVEFDEDDTEGHAARGKA